MFAIREYAEIIFGLFGNSFFFLQRKVSFMDRSCDDTLPHLFCKRQVGCGQGDTQAIHSSSPCISVRDGVV